MKLNQKIWYAIFSHNAYSAIAQKIMENEESISWAAVHIISKYKISPQSYEFIRLAKNNKFCFVCFSIDKYRFYPNDGLNPEDFKNYIVYTFDTEDELYRICELTNVDASKFTQKWHCEYPFW